MRKALLLICSILITGILPVMADGISVISFKLLDTDLTANTRGTQKLDQNGEKAALIRLSPLNTASCSTAVRWV